MHNSIYQYITIGKTNITNIYNTPSESALTICPEEDIPPSAITGTWNLRANRDTW